MLKQIQTALREADVDAVLITSPQNRRYATGFPSSAGVCLIDQKGGYLFTDFRYICLLYTSPSPRDAPLSRMPSSA